MESADSFIKELLKKRGVRVEYGLNVTAVDGAK